MKNIYFAWYLLTILPNLYSQQYNVSHYSTSQGLSNSCVYGIYQDAKGFLWANTEYGVNRFDGNSFTTFDVLNGFPENITLSTTSGPKGNILIGTFTKGIFSIEPDGSIKKVIDFFQGGQNMKVFYDDSIIYGFSNFNVASFNLRNKKYNYFESIANSDALIRSVCMNNKKIIIATKNGLYEFSDTDKKKINLSKNLNDVSALHCDYNNNIWIGSKGVIYKFDTKQKLISDSIVFDFKRSNTVDCILLDDQENIWFSTVLPISLYKVTKSSNYKITENVSNSLNISSTDINGLLLDKEKNIWIATYNKGLYCIKNTFLYLNDTYRNQYIISIFLDKKNNLYLGTIEGFSILDAKTNQWKTNQANKNQREYTYGYVEHDNRVFFLTNGIYPEHYTIKQNEISIVKLTARTVVFYNDSIALFGKWNNTVEVKKYKDGKFELYKTIKIDTTKNLKNRINKLIIDNAGTIWCGADLGLYTINIHDQTSKKITYKNTNGKINDLLVDLTNNLWVSTENGITKYDYKTWRSYSEFNNHKIRTVNSVTVDKKNRIYLGTLKGLFVIENKVINYLDDKSGLSSNEINKLVYDSINNKILIATNEGYSEFNIDQYEKFKKLPISVNLISAVVNNSILPLKNHYELKYSQKNISLNYVAINLTFPLSVIYQYQIDEGDWVNTLNNTLELASLTYGKHYVSIRASLDNKSWCEPINIIIEVDTPYFATVWFWILIFVIILTLISSLVLIRIKYIRKKVAEKLLIQQQIADLKFKSLNSSINPHFIFNSLNSIQNYINHNNKSQASNYLAKFARLIRLVLDKANDREISIKEEIERLKYYIQLEQDRFSQNFTYEIIVQDDLYDIQIPNMIVQPIVENAILHGVKNVSNGNIIIHFHISNEKLIIQVKDNGVGIDDSDNQQAPDHKSMAINNIKERLTLYPLSNFNIQSGNTGTIVEISIPLDALNITTTNNDY